MIEVEALRFAYPGAGEATLRGLDFGVARGEVFGFLGPNGAGKSTTQKILIGLLTGFDGRVQVLGDAPAGSDFYERIGVSFELPNHYLKLTGGENLSYFRALYRGRTRPPQELLELVELSDAADTPVSQYSKGMKSRLSVARSLLNDPELLFLDEPTTGLDPASSRRIRGLVREQRDAGKTVFLTTHDMVVADELCDRVAFIVDGEIVLTDAPRELKLQHGERRVRVEVLEADRPVRREFSLDGLGSDPDFLEIVRHPRLQTIHTLEATLEDIFIQVTGRALA